MGQPLHVYWVLSFDGIWTWKRVEVYARHKCSVYRLDSERAAMQPMRKTR